MTLVSKNGTYGTETTRDGFYLERVEGDRFRLGALRSLSKGLSAERGARDRRVLVSSPFNDAGGIVDAFVGIGRTLRATVQPVVFMG